MAPWLRSPLRCRWMRRASAALAAASPPAPAPAVSAALPPAVRTAGEGASVGQGAPAAPHLADPSNRSGRRRIWRSARSTSQRARPQSHEGWPTSFDPGVAPSRLPHRAGGAAGELGRVRAPRSTAVSQTTSSLSSQRWRAASAPASCAPRCRPSPRRRPRPPAWRLRQTAGAPQRAGPGEIRCTGYSPRPRTGSCRSLIALIEIKAQRRLPQATGNFPNRAP